jgi:glutamyl-tRNA synthetase
MSSSGCLFDFDKLNDVSKNVISRMSAAEVAEKVTAWAQQYDPEFGAQLAKDMSFTESIFAIGRGGKKPRKDLATWADAKPYMGFFFDSKQIDAYPDQFKHSDIKAALKGFLATYDESDDMNTWFEKVKAVAREIGYCDDMKAYKQSPESYAGSIADVSMFLRVAVTGKLNAPDLYTVMQILGKNNTVCRIESMIERLD